MKKILACFAAVFVSAALSAGELTFQSVCKQLSARPNMTGNFTQVKTIKKAGRELKSSGTFIFSLDGIMWKTLKPFPSTLAVGKTSVIQTMQDGRQTVIDASSNQIFTSIASTLSAVFSGNADALSANFTVQFSGDSERWRAILSPKDRAIAAVLQSITLSGANGADMNAIVMTEASGDTITYRFSDQKYPLELSDAEKSYFIAK